MMGGKLIALYVARGFLLSLRETLLRELLGRIQTRREEGIR